MLFTFDDTYKTGIEELDNQHMGLIDLAIKLQTMSGSQNDREILKEAIEYLCKYVTNHFNAEEYYMEKYKCPKQAQHRVMHLRFANRLTKFQDEVKNNPSSENVMKIRDFIIIWFKEHILKVDKEMGIYIVNNIDY